MVAVLMDVSWGTTTDESFLLGIIKLQISIGIWLMDVLELCTGKLEPQWWEKWVMGWFDIKKWMPLCVWHVGNSSKFWLVTL